MLIHSYFFIIGTIIGSFLTLCIDRIDLGQSIISPRSHCFTCHHLLRTYDLIPILSYCILNGKCRYCKQPFPPNSCLVELALGLLYLQISFVTYHPLSLTMNLLIATILIYLSLDDLTHTCVNVCLIGVLGILGLLKHPSTINLLLAFFLLISIFSHFQFSNIVKGFGEADIELIFVFAILHGIQSLPAIIFFASLTCLSFTLIFQKIVPRQIPFIPYLAFGYFLLPF